MTVNGVISRPTGRCCAKGRIPRELMKLGEGGRVPISLHHCCVFHPHLFFFQFPMEAKAEKKRDSFRETEGERKFYNSKHVSEKWKCTAVRWG